MRLFGSDFPTRVIRKFKLEGQQGLELVYCGAKENESRLIRGAGLLALGSVLLGYVC